MEKSFGVWVHAIDPTFAWLHRREPAALDDVSLQLARGLPVGDDFPGGMVFDLSPDHGMQLTDSIGNNWLLHVVSERLKDVIDKAGHPVEFHRIGIRNHKKRIAREPYYVMNLIGSLDAMDRGKSDWDESQIEPGRAHTIRRLELDLSKIPDDTKLFRLSADTSLILVRIDLANEIYRTRELRGMIFQRMDLYGQEFRRF